MSDAKPFVPRKLPSPYIHFGVQAVNINLRRPFLSAPVAVNKPGRSRLPAADASSQWMPGLSLP